MILCRKNEAGEWQRWNAVDDRFTVAVDTVRIRKDDDDNSEITVPVADVGMAPYTRTVLLSTAAVVAALANGAWGAADLVAAGLAAAVPFAAPEGKQRIGAERFEEVAGEPRQVFDVEDIPPPPEPETVEQKKARLFDDYGLTAADFAADAAAKP